LDAQQQPLGVDQQMPGAALYFFCRIVPALIATHGTCFDRLTTQNGTTRFGIAPKANAHIPEASRR
jgi:hypothetical protein